MRNHRFGRTPLFQDSRMVTMGFSLVPPLVGGIHSLKVPVAFEERVKSRGAVDRPTVNAQ